MTNPEIIQFLTDAKAHAQYDVSSLDAALTLITEGYKTDTDANQAAITDGIAKGIDAAVKVATQSLSDQIDKNDQARQQAIKILSSGGDPKQIIQDVLAVLQ